MMKMTRKMLLWRLWSSPVSKKMKMLLQKLQPKMQLKRKRATLMTFIPTFLEVKDRTLSPTPLMRKRKKSWWIIETGTSNTDDIYPDILRGQRSYVESDPTHEEESNTDDIYPDILRGQRSYVESD